MNLIALRGLIAEAFYEFFRFLYHFLLILIGGHLLTHPLRPEFQILAVRNLVVLNMREHYLHCTVGDLVQEFSVVGYQKQTPLSRRQEVFQPFYGFYVQMVSGLVQKQHVVLSEKEFGQFYPHIPALGEGLGEP